VTDRLLSSYGTHSEGGRSDCLERQEMRPRIRGVGEENGVGGEIEQHAPDLLGVSARTALDERTIATAKM